MDPLSMSLAVITFATAVKDIVELGQKIHESFTKASRNYQKAQSVAKDITEMVDEIKQFCEDHKEELDNMKDFRLAVLGLLATLRDFEASVLPLLPQAGGRKRDRITRAWDAWRNNNQIEEGIVNLQSDIMKVMRRYIWKSAMRAEVELGKLRQETSRGLTGISQGLAVLQAVREDVSVIRVTTAANSTVHNSYESSASGSSEFDRQIIMFAQSTSSASAPMLRTPNVITEELMTAAYIKLQVNSIIATLDKISKLPIPTSDDVNDFHMYPSMEVSVKITDLRHYVIRLVLDIRDLLDAESMQTISIQEGARLLNNLSLGLRALHMGAESVQLGTWATRLARTLVGSGAMHPDLCAALCVYLTNQSVQYFDNGDKIQSLQAIKEAHTVALDLRNRFIGEVRFQILYSHVLVHYAPLEDIQGSVDMLAEAVRVLEDILMIQEFTRPETPDRLKAILQSSSSFLDRLFSSQLPVIAISDYALALQGLGICFFVTGRCESAVDFHLLAIAVLRKMVSIHGNEHKLALARALMSLVQRRQTAKGHIPAEVLISLVDECIHLLRELTEYNPMYHVPGLIDALWEKAMTLESMERRTEEIEILEEVLSLEEQLLDNSTLRVIVLDRLCLQFRSVERHDDAIRTNTRAIAAYRQLGDDSQALRYHILSTDLMLLQRYKESTVATQKSITLYQRIAMKSPERQVAGHLVALISKQAYCLAASGDYSGALIAWEESLSRLEQYLLTKPDASSTASSDYLISLLHAHIGVSYLLENEEESSKVSSTAAQYLRQWSELWGPQNSRATEQELLWAEFTYAYNLFRLGRLQDAQTDIENWVDRWGGRLEAAPNPDITAWHARMLSLKSNILDAQGRTNEAYLVNRRICNIVRPFIGTHHPCFVAMIDSMICGAHLQVNLGNNEEALKVAEEALRLSRDDQPGPVVPTPVLPLHGVASIALLCRNYARAVEVALEGCRICASSSWQDGAGRMEFHTSFRPGLLAHLSSAEANLSRYSTAVEYAKKAVEVSLDTRDKLNTSATSAEQSYMETRGNLAEILLGTGDFAQARQICEERRTYFSKRVDTRMGEYRDLAPILRMLGILCCSEGRHDEGSDAAQELMQIVKTLGSTFPSLQKQVKVRLRHQARVPILKVLDDMCQKLDCEHQTGVASLFST